MRLLRQVFGARTPPAPTFQAPLAPETPFYAIGDIHGCDRLLATVLERIRLDAGPDRPQIVCAGDYVDRGEDNRAVLERLRMLEADPSLDLICLMGNHEDMLLRFLERPESAWLQNGGLQTLASFGVGLPEGVTPTTLLDIRDRLEMAMGPNLIAWLRERPVMWQTGNVAVVHAGADPMLPLDLQSREVLLWGHPDFNKQTRRDGTWIVHGHTIVDKVCVENGRISIDTGAYATKRLSAVHISAEGVRPLDT